MADQYAASSPQTDTEDAKPTQTGGGTFARLPIAALTDPKLKDGDFRVLSGICAYMRPDNYAWPSQLLLGLVTGRSRCAANRSIKRLEGLGHIDVHRYRHHDGSLRCTYQVKFAPRRLPQLPKRGNGGTE